MGDAPKCAARSKRSGRPCGKLGLRRPDGTFTRHCRFHGGVQERAPVGDDTRPGRPPTSHRFARAIRNPEDREDFEAFLVDVTNLERQIALAELNCLRFMRRCEASEKGGIPTSVAGGGQSVSIESYDRIIRSYLETIGRLRERKARIDHMGNPDAPPPAIRFQFGDADEVSVEDALSEILERRGLEPHDDD
jgi:hypothetical protein